MDSKRIYVPLQAGAIRAFDRETGEVLWEQAGDTRWSPLIVGNALVTALTGTISAMQANSGTSVWTRAIDQPLSGSLATAGDRVLVPTAGGEIVALNIANGATEWRRSLGAATRHAPAVLTRSPDTRTIVVTLVDGRVVALDGRTGDVTWERTLPETLSAPAVARDRVFIGSTNNFFYALDADSGKEEWRWRTGGDVIGAAAYEDIVYFASLDNVLRAVNRDNGNQRWKEEIPTRPSGPPLAVGDVVLTVGVSPRLDGFVGKTGAAVGSYTAVADLQGVPAIDGNLKPFSVAMVVFTRDGRVTALRPTRMMLPEPPLVPFLKLPGRELPPETSPIIPKRQTPSPSKPL
jgi:outer membrane protein assembly factor BamB